MCKTAHCILRFKQSKVKAIFDEKFTGSSLKNIFPMMEKKIPIINQLNEIDQMEDALVIAFAPVGGRLSERQKEIINLAIHHDLFIINCSHEIIAEYHKVLNLRAFNQSEKWIAQGKEFNCTRILTVGTSHSIGKMTATCLLNNLFQKSGISSTWIATGQTGTIIADKGTTLDSIPIDFVPGHLEKMIEEAEKQVNASVIIIEGQGSIFHPSYSPTSIALYHTSRPQFLVMCHRLGQKKFWQFNQDLPSIDEAIEAYKKLGDCLQIKSRFIGISLDSSRVSEQEYLLEKDRLKEKFGLPCFDAIRYPEHLEEILDIFKLEPTLISI